MNLPETARRRSRVVAPVLAYHTSAAMGRSRRAVEQQDLWHKFVDKLVEQNFGEEAAPAVRRDKPGPDTLCRTAAASRRGPTGGLGDAALDRAASGARAAADNQPTWQLWWRDLQNQRLWQPLHIAVRVLERTVGLLSLDVETRGLPPLAPPPRVC